MQTQRPNYEPPILRTHRLITKGIPAHAGDVIMLSAAESLQALAIGSCTCGPSTRGETCLGAQSHINRLRQAPPERRSLHELLSTASHIAKAFVPLSMEHGTATFNQEAA